VKGPLTSSVLKKGYGHLATSVFAGKPRPGSEPVLGFNRLIAPEAVIGIDERKRVMVARVKTSQFDQEVIESSVPVLVDFYADWCGPCRLQSPILDELATESGGSYHIVKVDVDQEPELAARFGVTALPTLLLINGGEVTERLVGLANKAKLRTLLSGRSV
jgi:thioredoxin 1